MGKPQPPKRKPALAAAPVKPEGEQMPLSHAAAFALRDLATHYGQSEREQAEYAIGLWHWLTGKLVEGRVLWLADADGDGGQRVELPAVGAPA